MAAVHLYYMKKTILLCICIVAVSCLFSQKQSFDLFFYTPPKGWNKEEQKDIVSYVMTDAKTKTWCRIAVLNSTASKGSIENDFASEWKEFPVRLYNVTGNPQTEEVQEAEGWKIKAGTGTFTYNNAAAAAILTTFSGYNRCASIFATTNSNEYLTNIQEFLATIELKKPEGEITSSLNTGTNNNGAVSNKGSYAFYTTNFNDGWVSEIKNDWVEVTKGDIKVYLWYALQYDYKMFSGTGVVDRDYYWDNYVSKYYNIETKQYKDDGEVIGSLKPTYVEGWATDKQTGEKRFIGMRLSISPNTAYITIGSAKDEASLWKQFPKANGGSYSTSDLSAMSGYNKFAVSVNDLTGTWQDGNTNTAQWYYVTPGGYEGYAGMTVAARTATFNFNGDGSYTSIHNGATGAVGAMNTFQQNYKGKYTVTDWGLTATNRFNGKTDNFEAYFKVIRGGRLLCLNGGGMEYTLVKIK